MEQQDDVAARDAAGEPAPLGQFNGHEVYPMPVFATVSTTDVAGVAAWYQAALGFSAMFALPGPDGAPVLAHLRRHRYQDVLIARAPVPPEPGGGALSLSFSADGEIDSLAVRAATAPPRGQSRVETPALTAWNTLDLVVHDPLGNRLVFTSRPAQPDPAVTQQWEQRFRNG